jgi:endonuclease/exonuclease/phosphatase family metal-dependent hydrolase
MFAPMRAVVLLALALFLAPASAMAAPPPPSGTSEDVTVMSFNVWLGGDVVDFGKATEAIRAADADIVGLQEAEGNTERIAKALGWSYWSDRLHVVSRYPLIDPPAAKGAFVLAQVRPGEVFALANVHLTSEPYGPYAVRDGKPLKRVLKLERSVRLPEIRATFRALRNRLPAGVPTFLTGDFNTPSHLDWTPAVAAVRPAVKYPVEWPVTKAVAAAGFVDAYRAVHPDPVQHPGITWTFGYPFPRLAPDEAVDRIDMIHALRATQVLDAGIVGPSGTQDATIGVDPYPSDHRGVYARVRLTPTAPGSFASVLDRRVTRGSPISVRYAAPRGSGSDRLAVVRAGDGPGNALMELPPHEAEFYGSVTFASGGLKPGRYDVLLTSRGRVLSRSTFWVVKPGARPGVSVPKRVEVGRRIKVSWRNAPADRFDWIGIYKASDTDLYNDYLAFAYTGATVAGRTSFAGSRKWYPPGRYVARLMRDDGYGVLAEVPFTIVER